DGDSRLRPMGDPAGQLKAVGAANRELHETAKQALEWVRVSEERVARAEARNERVRGELKQRAMETLRRVSEAGRQRLAHEREARKGAEAGATRAKADRDRAEKAFEQSRRRAEADSERLAAESTRLRAESERDLAEAVQAVEGKAKTQRKEAL